MPITAAATARSIPSNIRKNILTFDQPDGFESSVRGRGASYVAANGIICCRSNASLGYKNSKKLRVIIVMKNTIKIKENTHITINIQVIKFNIQNVMVIG